MKTAKPISLANAMSQADAVLLEDLRKLEDATRVESRPALGARLKSLAAHLAEHFRLEEQGGYMDAVRKRQPNLEREVQHLQDEHRELTGILRGLLDEAGAGTGADGPFQEKVRSLIEHIRRHEMREYALVEDAFNLDIGAED